jgi:hypothetical protein
MSILRPVNCSFWFCLCFRHPNNFSGNICIFIVPLLQNIKKIVRELIKYCRSIFAGPFNPRVTPIYKVNVGFIAHGNISEHVRRSIWPLIAICSNNLYTFNCIKLHIHSTAFSSEMSHADFRLQIITRPGLLLSLIPGVQFAQTRYFLGTINSANRAQHPSLLPYILPAGSQCNGL